MGLITSLADPRLPRGALVSIGNFDGVHAGHAILLGSLVERARAAGRASLVLTFEPHPLTILRPGAIPPRLTTPQRKAELMARLGVDEVLAYPTSSELLSMSPQEFFDEVLIKRLDIAGLVEGPNFLFGAGRRGDVALLERLCASRGMVCHIVDPVQVDGEWISSSSVRRALSEGNVETASRLLGRPYRLAGLVVSGAQRGRTIGFPTANLAEIATVIPRDGVYGGIATVAGIRYPVAMNIGANPTFGEADAKVELHLVGYAGDLYGSVLEVDFLGRLRDTQSFSSLDALKSQLERDVIAAKQLADCQT